MMWPWAGVMCDVMNNERQWVSSGNVPNDAPGACSEWSFVASAGGGLPPALEAGKSRHVRRHQYCVPVRGEFSQHACLRVLAMPETVRPTYDGAVQAEFLRCELPPHLLVAIWAASCSLHAPAGPSLGFLRSTCPSPGEDAPSPGRPGR